uniref:HAD-IIIA family hydrolase n=1 Tax=Candidatus Onthocola sp. TaxID=3085646 RepID=UPI003FEF99A5
MKAVIMAGGKGTRISSITNDEIPKPMLKIGDKTILEHQIDCLKKSNIDEIILVIGHLGEKIKDYFKDGTNFGVKISYYEENPEKPLGTAGSFYYLKDKIDEDFILVFGDVFLSVDFTKMVEFHKNNKSDATLLTHPNSHPFDSDLVVVNNENKVETFDSKENVRNYDYKNLVNSGIYCFSPKVFDYVNEPKKYGLEKDVISKMIINGDNVYSYHSTEYVKDMGTPERFYAVNDDYANGISEQRNLLHKQKAIFLDRDGTINVYIPFLVNKEKFELIDGASEAIKKINSSDYLCIVVTNQPIIARGESSFENLEDIHKRMETLLGRDGAYIDGLYFCPHHKDKGFPGEVPELKFDCDCRKPKIGMLLEAVKDFNIDLSESVVIGDSTLDIKMAENANMKSILVKTGQAGLDGKYDVTPTEVAEDLLDAVNIILTKEERRRR